MESVCQFNQDHTDIFGKCEQHFPEILCLLGSTIFEYATNFGEPIDDAGDLLYKHPFDVCQLDVSVFNNIMHKGGNNGGSSQADLLHTNFGNRQRMKNERFSGFAPHVFMRLQRDRKSLFNELGVSVFE